MHKLSDGKKCLICLALTIIMGVLLLYTYADEGSAYDGLENQHEGFIRLHVIANSDTPQDQQLKLKVRDAIIGYMKKQDQLSTVSETRHYLNTHLEQLEKISEGIVASEGYDYPVSAALGIRYIPEKTYGSLTFPAGNYEALNISIGEGCGQNWWCVLFPPLCLLEEGTTTDDTAGDAIRQNAADVTGSSSRQDPEDNSQQENSSQSVPESQQLQLRWKVQEMLQKQDPS